MRRLILHWIEPRYVMIDMPDRESVGHVENQLLIAKAVSAAISQSPLLHSTGNIEPSSIRFEIEES